MLMHLYNPVTKEYISSEITFKDPVTSKAKGEDVYLLCPNSTIKEPLKPKSGYAVVFNGEEWGYIEDNRGKEYWLPEDSYLSQPRIMNNLGEFPADALFNAPEMPFDALLENTLQDIKRIRKAQERAGVVVNGIKFGTSEKDETRLNAAFNAFEKLKKEQIPNWKVSDGVYVDMNQNLLYEIFKAINDKHDKLFAWEREKIEEVNILTTISELKQWREDNING